MAVPSVTVIIPIRDGADLLSSCLASVLPQAESLGARVLVVDDASTDATAELAERAGADVLPLARPRGPYAARNAGWRAADTTTIVFTDARCRARAGWLENLVGALDPPDTAIAGGDVWVTETSRLAGQAAHAAQPLLARRSVNDRFLPFVATCALATKRAVLEQVEGFTEVRGGGDVDFCWRVQLAGLGDVRWAPDAEMDWVPRDTLRALFEQHRRYGANTRWLQERFAADGCPVDVAAARWKVAGAAARDAVVAARRTAPRRWPVLAVGVATRVVTAEGHRHWDESTPERRP